MVNATTTQENYLQLNAEVARYDSNGLMQLHKDKEAAKAYFLQHVNPNTVFFHSLREKIEFLWDNDYYEREFIEQYSWNFVAKIYDKAYAYRYRFASFVGAYKFYNQYALKTFDGERYLERYEDRVVANALLQGGGNEKQAEALMHEIMSNRYLPATPTFLNAGKKQRGSYVSCYLISVSDDLNSIGRAVNSALQLSKAGGGVAFNFSNIRAAGDPIKNIEGASSGVIPPMKIMENSFNYANQLGARDGAGAVYLHAHHLDILDFLDTKKINADDKSRIETLSLGVIIPDITMQLFREGKDMYLFSPYDVTKKYGIPFSQVDITDKYDELVSDENIRKKKITARAFFARIAAVQAQSGYPYILFVDSANKQSPIAGKIEMSNLCSEILQVQEASVLADDQTYQTIGRDISCNLGSMNVKKSMEGDLGQTVETAVRALSWVATHSDMTVVPSIKDGNEKARAIGLGIMNLHGWLADNHLEYGSSDALEATGLYIVATNYHSIRASANLARETGDVFDGYENSTYASGEYFDHYLETTYAPTTEKVAKMFANQFVPSREDWNLLKLYVRQHGMFNQNRLAIAPTGSTAYHSNSTPSYLPVTDIIEARKEGLMGTVQYPAPELREDNRVYYKNMYQLGPKPIIDTAAVLQKHVDQGMSTTIGFKSGTKTDAFNKAQYYAWSKGLKTLYYVRVETDVMDGLQAANCVSCEV